MEYKDMLYLLASRLFLGVPFRIVFFNVEFILLSILFFKGQIKIYLFINAFCYGPFNNFASFEKEILIIH